MAVSKFAKELSDQLREFFSIKDRGELAVVIEFNARFIERHRDEMASLLFIEFSECKEPEITLEIAKKVIARVQKRIYRSTQDSQSEIKKEVPSSNYLSESEIQSVVKDYFKTLRSEDMVLFHLRHLEGKSVRDIGNEMGVSKSTVYQKLDELRESFEQFLAKQNKH